MARDVYSLRIFATAGLAPGAGRVGPVVPAGFVYVVRDVDAICVDSTPAAKLEMDNPLLGPVFFWEGPTPYAPTNFMWRGRQVYAEGEQVGFVSGAGTWSIMCSGYQLTLP